VVDEDRVLRLLRSIADDTAVLRQEAGASEERRMDPIWLRGVKYTFVTAIEACVGPARRAVNVLRSGSCTRLGQVGSTIGKPNCGSSAGSPNETMWLMPALVTVSTITRQVRTDDRPSNVSYDRQARR